MLRSKPSNPDVLGDGALRAETEKLSPPRAGLQRRDFLASFFPFLSGQCASQDRWFSPHLSQTCLQPLGQGPFPAHLPWRKLKLEQTSFALVVLAFLAGGSLGAPGGPTEEEEPEPEG